MCQALRYIQTPHRRASCPRYILVGSITDQAEDNTALYVRAIMGEHRAREAEPQEQGAEGMVQGEVLQENKD